MAQKAEILLYQEANTALISTVNYFISQGLPVYTIQHIVEVINNNLLDIVDQETKKAQEEYQQALALEQKEQQAGVEKEAE